VETKIKVEQEGSRTEQKEYNGMQEVSAEADKSPSDISSWALAPRALTQSLNLTSSGSGLRDVRGTVLVSAILPSNVWWRGCA